ncbi:MAG: single-stranded DNA-binding protein [Saprospiraceae bacterium]
MNQITLMGNVGQDPEIRTTQTGKKVINFTLATKDKFNETEITTWHSITGWGWLADLPIKKGSEVIVFGKLQNEKYKNKDGNEVTKYYILASVIKVALNTKFEKISEVKTSEPKQAELEDFNGMDSLPF